MVKEFVGIKTKLHTVKTAVIIVLLAFSIGILTGVIGGMLFTDITSDSLTNIVEFVFMYLGMGTTVLIYIKTRHGLSFVDIHEPTRNTFKYVLIGVVFATIVTIGFNVLVNVLQLHSNHGPVSRQILISPSIIPVLIVIVFLLNAPVEELVFRNLMQKTLTEEFTVWGSIFITSSIFTVIHIPNHISTQDPNINMVTVLSLLVIFVMSCVFGYYYWKSEDILVPTLIHGFYNILQLSIIVFGNGLLPEII